MVKPVPLLMTTALAVTTFAFGAVPAAAAGTTYTWVGSSQVATADNHSWGDQGNWSPQGVPGDGDSVVIGSPATICAAHVDGIPAVTLVNFTMTETPGRCGVSVTGGGITVTGLFQWNSGTISAPVTVAGVGTMGPTDGHLKVLAQNLDVTGVLTLTQSQDLTALRIVNPNRLTIKPGGTFVSAGDNDISFSACCVNPARVVNEGTVKVTTGTLRVTAVQFDQNAELEVAGGAQLLTTRGPVTAGAGADYSGGGSWNIGWQSIARFSGTQNLTAPFRLILGGDATAPGGRLGGTFTLAGTGARLDWLAGTIEANLTVTQGFSIVANGATTRRTLSGLDNTGPTAVAAKVTNHGTISFSGGAGYTGVGRSTLVNASDGVLNLAPGTLIDAQTCCVSPDRIVNQGGRIAVGSSSGTATVIHMLALESQAGVIAIAPGKQLQLTGNARSKLVATLVGAGGRLLVAAPVTVSGTVTVKTPSNLALVDRGSLDGTATIAGGGSTVWSGGSFSGNVTLSTTAGLRVYPTAIKYLRTVNGGSTPSSLRITVPTTILAGTVAVPNRFDLGSSKLTFAATTSVGNRVRLYGGQAINTGSLTFGAGTGGQIAIDTGEFVNSGTVRLTSGTVTVQGVYRQTAGSTAVGAGTTLAGYFSSSRVLITAGYLTGTGLIKTSLYNDKGVISPGGDAAGTLRVTGTFTQGKTGTLRLDVAKNSRDRLTVDGTASIAGKLKFNTLGSAAPAVGTTQTLLTSKALTLTGVCGYTAGAGSTTGKWVHSVSAGKNLVVVRQAGKDTTC